jgi:hypothetical protein
MKICNKCGSEVFPEVSEELKKEYPYYCEECDENMYEFEVVESMINKQFFIATFEGYLIGIYHKDKASIVKSSIENKFDTICGKGNWHTPTVKEFENCFSWVDGTYLINTYKKRVCNEHINFEEVACYFVVEGK